MATDIFLDESQQSGKTFESSRKANSPDGWITTNGIFYPCSPEEHDKLADYLLKIHQKFIESLLIEGEHYEMMGRRREQPARNILKAARFALISDNQLSEANLPEILSLKQREFIERNNLIFMPKSGELDLAAYHSFLETAKDLPGVQRLLQRKNVVITKFLDDPTKIIHIADNDLFAQEVFKILSEVSTATISLKYNKGIVTWSQLNIPNRNDVFLEHDFHNHGYDSTPEKESWVSLVSKQAVKKYIDNKGVSGYHSKGDLSVLN